MVPLGYQSMLTDPLTGLVDIGFRQYDGQAEDLAGMYSKRAKP